MGCEETEDESHLLRCPVLIDQLSVQEKVQLQQVKMEFIYQSTIKQNK